MIAIIIIAILSVGIYLIINKGNETIQTSISSSNETKKTEEKTIESFKSKLQENGVSITNEIEKSAMMIGAEEGIGYEINKSVIEIYKFNEESNEEIAKNNIKSAKSKGIINMLSFNNMELKVKYNKGLCLVKFEKHPDKDKIVDIFTNL